MPIARPFVQLASGLAAGLLLSFSAQASSTSEQQKVNTDSDHLQAYKNQAHQLLASLENKSEQSGPQAKTLVELSKPILADFKALYPQCSEYLNALDSAADTMAELPLEEIESGYHADGKLPPLPDANCYHAKDLLVHPATVQAMARIGIEGEKQWEQAEHEIEEVIEHFSQVEIAYQD